MSENTRIWDALSKTDPKHTKPFKRSGGFSGTALKPMWVWQRLTEHFGPFGEGWGCGEPSFQVVPTEKEVLVYCTVSAWHGTRENVIWGVGGDKAVSVNKYGPSADDEAFKKAFTDALMNAFKFIGVGADIHMGQFDDQKYVREVAQEFASEEPQRRAQRMSPGADDPGGSKDTAAQWAAWGRSEMAKFAEMDMIVLKAWNAENVKNGRLAKLERHAPDTYEEASAAYRERLAELTPNLRAAG